MEWMHKHKDIEAQLPDDAEFRFNYALRHGTMKAGLYAPRSEDTQGPHKQDELYVIISGNGQFIKNGETRGFAPSDIIFVEAGTVHRFLDFSEDFATWVIFWGPEGGEGAVS